MNLQGIKSVAQPLRACEGSSAKPVRTDTIMWSGLADANLSPMFYANADRGFMLTLSSAF